LGNWTFLSIGKKYRLDAPKYEIPYCWCILFDAKENKSILKSNVNKIKTKILERGFTFGDLERYISFSVDVEAKLLRQMREFLLNKNTEINKLIKKLGHHRDSISDDPFIKICDAFDKEFLNKSGKRTKSSEDFMGIFNILEYYLEEGLGSFELVLLYQLLIFLELSDDDDEVRLDLSDFEGDTVQLFEEARETFVNSRRVYEYLFSHSVDEENKVNIASNQIKNIENEDLYIDRILIPLLEGMGFQNVVRTPYHGPNEKGVDIGPTYVIDRFMNREFYGVQAKKVKIHDNARISEGNIGLICNQIEKGMQSEFTCENNQVTLNKFLLITSKTVTEDAKTFAFKKFKDRIQIFDHKDIAKYLVRYNVKYTI